MTNGFNRLTKGFLVVCGCLFSAPHSSGHSLGNSDESSARKSVHILTTSFIDDPAKIETVLNLWHGKCGKKNTARSCYLEECDIEKDSCRPGRKILFRAEAAIYPLPAISSLVQAHWNGSDYASWGDARDLLNALRLDIELLGPFTSFPQYKNDIILIRESRSSAGVWKYKGVDLEFRPQYDTNKKPLTFRNTIFAFHQENALFYFRDRNIGDVSLDPLVSFTMSPTKAMTYFIGHGKGRLIVASVPQSEIDMKCDGSVPTPGILFDPVNCLTDERFGEEYELDAALYLNPDYLWQTFIIEY